MTKRTAGESTTLVERTGVGLQLPQSFYESIFAGFAVMRHEGTDRCVRFAVGDEDKGCFLPFYDHRPLVIAAARIFDAEPSAPNALALFRELREPAEVEVRTRHVKDQAVPFVNLWECAGPKAGDLVGTEDVWDAKSLSHGTALPGRFALWYWLGLVPTGQGALRLVHLALLPR